MEKAKLKEILVKIVEGAATGAMLTLLGIVVKEVKGECLPYPEECDPYNQHY